MRAKRSLKMLHEHPTSCLLFPPKWQWRNLKSASPGCNALILSIKTYKLTRTLRNVNLYCFSVLLWTITILRTSCANYKVTDVCNLCEINRSRKVQKGFWCFPGQADSSPLSPSTGTSVQSYLEGNMSIFLPKQWWELGVICVWVCDWASAFQAEHIPLHEDWTN